MNKINSKFVLGLTAATSTLVGSFVMTTLPAQALTWTVNGTFPIAQTLSGTFDIDDEAAPGASVTAASLTVGASSFALADFQGFGPNDPTLGNDITTLVFSNGNDTLTLIFTSPLTSGGGLRILDAVGTNFDNGITGVAPVPGGTASAPSPPRIVPFNFSTTPGLVVLGLIFGGNKVFQKWKDKKNKQ